ncbi:MAG: hypothetical protein ICCCNLDF_02796 [Planctomycetes bacterium]|nr:hypothetical protein [Planctomycetota bacterium]
MSKQKQQEEHKFRSWYRDVIRQSFATLGFHPEAVPVAGWWRKWFQDGLSPQAAVAEFNLQLKAA